VLAISPGYYPPVRPAIATPAAQPQLSAGVCHDAGCTAAQPFNVNQLNFFSVDLFDSTWDDPGGAPIYATTYGVVQSTQKFTSNPRTNSTSIRYGNVSSGQGYGYYNGHGAQGSVGPSVGDILSPGQVIMKMGDTGTSVGNAHLHFEIRELVSVTQWSVNFTGYCAKHYINKLMNNASVFPYTLAATDAFGGVRFNNCKGLTS
jgi:hypothetical protein